MSTKKAIKNLKTLNQIRKEKSRTSWGRLIAEEKSLMKQDQKAQKNPPINGSHVFTPSPKNNQ
jgi:hypothetical protein